MDSILGWLAQHWGFLVVIALGCFCVATIIANAALARSDDIDEFEQ